MELRPRLVGPLLALLALVPVLAYTVAKEQYWLVLSVACVVLIAGSLYYLFSPAEGAEHEDAAPR